VLGPALLAKVHWRGIGNDSDPVWQLTRVLYAYIHLNGREILYIGKADGCSVRERWNHSHKEGFWEALEKERGIFEHSVIVGEIELEGKYRLSRELLADIESLLIKRIRPWGNIQSIHSRISRPGLQVECSRNWPIVKRRFYDVG